MAFWTLAFVFLLSAAVPARAQNAPALPKTPDMEIGIVRGASAACEPDCPEWISAQGSIKADTPQKLQRVIQSLKGRKLPILLDSPGGQVDAGIAMGQIIRKAELVTAVGRSPLPQPCKPQDATCRRAQQPGPARGLFNLRRSLCASACTFVLAGGVRRVVHPDARLGVHQITATETTKRINRRYLVQWRMINGRKVEVSRRLISERVVSQQTKTLSKIPDRMNAQLERHFIAMGLAPSFGEKTRATPSSSIYYIPEAEMRSHRIATDTTNLVASLGLNPDNRYFTAALSPASYVGYKSIMLRSGEATMEFSTDATPEGDKAPVSIRILQANKPLDAAGWQSELRLYDGAVYRATPPEGGATGVLRFDLTRAQLCNIKSFGLAVITLSEKSTQSTTPHWMRSGNVADVMPIAPMQNGLCPQNHWER